MRTFLLLAGSVMLMLAAGPALAQNAFGEGTIDPSEMLSDPVPVAKPQYPPSAVTAGIAVESPAANTASRTASARQGGVVPCSDLNPCAVVPPLPPLPPVKSG